MDEAEQLCDRLIVVDKGRIMAEGSPAALIRDYSTREVLELRFGSERNASVGAELEGIGERVETLPGPGADLHPRRRGGAGTGHRARAAAADLAGAPVLAGGRVPAAHRQEPR